MSKSLEALEVIECILSNHQTMLEAKDKRFEFINTIKQDLERKEELEKENEDLKVFVDAYANARDELLIRNEQLEKENQKLKKAIDWLKHTFEITLDSKVRISDGIDCIQAFPIDMKNNEVIYELLKEVLENE